MNLHRMSRTPHRRVLFTALLGCILLLLSVQDAGAQARLKLKRTNDTKIPWYILLYGGYNGMSEPSEQLQDMFENTVKTSWGGVIMAAQGLVQIDTLWRPLLGGVEVYYQRMVSRHLAKREEVHYPDDTTPVESIETLWAWGVQAIIAWDVHENAQIGVGGGFQHIYSQSDVEGKVTGLMQPVTFPTVSGQFIWRLLKYDHGSINGFFRVMKGFGEWGSIEFHSAVLFSFDF